MQNLSLSCNKIKYFFLLFSRVKATAGIKTTQTPPAHLGHVATGISLGASPVLPIHDVQVGLME